MADIVYAMCNEKIDRDALLNHAQHTFNKVLCVDGTSATKKTSILEKTGYQVTKLQRLAKFKNINRYFPSMLGYICTGVRYLNYGSRRFNDRSPLNPLEWHVLWCCMSDYFLNYGNVKPNDLSKYENIMKSLKNSFFYDFFQKKINCIVFIDSNCMRCDELRYKRNNGSDRERSQWRFYTPMQNMMYSVLYEGRVIDMAWFDNFTTDIVCQGISMWISDLVNEMAKLNNQNNISLPKFHLPLNFPEIDYSLENMKTHAYRSIGRIGCKIINNECDKKNMIDTLKYQYLTQWVNVNQIEAPQCAILYQNHSNIEALDYKYEIKESLEPFVRSTIKYETPMNIENDFTNDDNDDDGDFRESDFFN
uniref:PfdB protein n=1 Tax=Fopius arisanus TaxID=64838 RepID=A0A0C9RL27_9HYME